MDIFLFLIIYAAQGIAFGIAANSIIENKGYNDNWFWWGFFFGFIALLVALSKPEVPKVSYSENLLLKKVENDNILNNGGWKCCYCNSINASYVTSCSCGRNKDESEQRRKRMEKSARASADSFVAREARTIELIGQYKKLLDSGSITQAEFETKKQALLSSQNVQKSDTP